MTKEPSSMAFNIRESQRGNRNIFPEIIYLDANPAIDIANQRTYGKVLEGYIQDLARKGKMITWSEVTKEEVTGVIHNSKYDTYADQHDIKDEYYTNGNFRRPARKVAEGIVSQQEATLISLEVLSETDKIFQVLEQYGMQLENQDEQEIKQIRNYLYGNYGGGLKDAKHIAYANLSGVNNILSNDSGLLRYPCINVYGASVTVINFSNSKQLPVPYIDMKQHMEQKKNSVAS